MSTESTTTRQKLTEDIMAVISSAEELLNATAGQAGEKIQSVRAKAEESLKIAKTHIDEIEQIFFEEGKAAAKATDKYVHENPWYSIGIAAGVGLIAGWLLCRK